MLNKLLESFARESLVIPYESPERMRIKTSFQALQSRAKEYFSPEDFEGIESFGSWNRNTILPRSYDPDSDLDVMMVFKRGSYWNSGSEAARARVQRFASRKYSTSEVHFDLPCVKLELGHIKFDLVPAVRQQWTGGFLIPDGKDGWMSTDPNQLADRLTNVNKRVGDNLVRRVLRLCKYWNKRKERSRISSYELESAVVDTLPYVPYGYGQPTFSTYDGFLYCVREICGRYYSEFFHSTTPSILDSVIVARRAMDYEGQLTWMNHLLPGIR